MRLVFSPLSHCSFEYGYKIFFLNFLLSMTTSSYAGSEVSLIWCCICGFPQLRMAENMCHLCNKLQLQRFITWEDKIHVHTSTHALNLSPLTLTSGGGGCHPAHSPSCSVRWGSSSDRFSFRCCLLFDCVLLQMQWLVTCCALLVLCPLLSSCFPPFVSSASLFFLLICPPCLSAVVLWHYKYTNNNISK